MVRLLFGSDRRFRTQALQQLVDVPLFCLKELQLLDGYCGLRAVSALSPETFTRRYDLVVTAAPALPGTDCCVNVVCVPVANLLHYGERLFHAV